MRSQHNFSQTPSVNIPRSTFNLSHPHKTCFDADDLVPICQPIDIISGDTFNFKTSYFMRLATPLEPILDNLHFDYFAFFVAYRTIWENHERFHGAQDDPGDSISFTIPLVSRDNASGTPLGSLWDHFGLPPLAIPDDLPVSSLPFRAYAKIWNEWFRSATLQDSWNEETDNGTDFLITTNAAGNIPAQLLKRGKRFDYFTGALPAPQRGTAPSVSLGTTAPVDAENAAIGPTFQSYAGDSFGLMNQLGTTPNVWQFNVTDGAAKWLDPNLEADLSAATGISINDIRLAFATQQILERDARSGTRYVESLQARWGVVSPDFRLQRAELLGTGSSRVMINPVTQNTASTTPTSPAAQDKLGNLAGVGTASGTHSWSKSFVEHGVVIVLGNLRADLSYS